CLGRGLDNNWCARAPGEPSKARALIFGTVQLVLSLDPTRALRIWAPHDHLPRVLTHWAPALAAQHWACPHADLLVPLTDLLIAR
ncbi:hypothetical protein BV20DRAFT_926686, partial [Pilatotrama ljubarskyi]